jgi:hypothetical protein
VGEPRNIIAVTVWALVMAFQLVIMHRSMANGSWPGHHREMVHLASEN